MLRQAICVAAILTMIAACSPSRDFHGYVPDEAFPRDIQPDEDTRTTVLAQLGSPSMTSTFDDNTWIYMSTTRERRAYFNPKVVQRSVVAVRFDEEDVVAEVLEYDLTDGRVVEYAARETPTRGRELGLLEQIFGNIGRTVLPPTQENVPGQRPN